MQQFTQSQIVEIKQQARAEALQECIALCVAAIDYIDLQTDIELKSYLSTARLQANDLKTKFKVCLC